MAVVNSTAALHAPLVLNGVGPGDLVITQAFTFIATCNAIAYTGARPVFIDVDPDTFGLSPRALERWLGGMPAGRDGCVHVRTGARVRACIPMHLRAYGAHRGDHHPLQGPWDRGDRRRRGGARFHPRRPARGHVRSVGTLSFNGNKIVTCGGGGALLFEDPRLADRAST